MKKFDMKSLIAGIIMGSLGITTVFAATEIKSARLSNTKIMLNGEALPLSKPMVSLLFDDEQDADLYAPINELLGKLGYIVQYDNINDTMDFISGNCSVQNVGGEAVLNGDAVFSGGAALNGDAVFNGETALNGEIALNGEAAFNGDSAPADNGESALAGSKAEKDIVINLTNNAEQKNIAESGSFLAEDNQKLTLMITSDIQGGIVDLFLFAPNGKEQRITIGSGDMTKEIALEKGIWQYNCSGIFINGGNIKIVGVME